MTRKYTDTDVRSNSYSLFDLAGRYLATYQGDFAFLVSAKAAWFDSRLTVQMVRGVLNCMLSDPNVKNMPTAGDVYFDAKFISNVEIESSSNPNKQHGNSSGDLPWIVSRKLPTRWRKQFLVLNHMQASVVHYLDTDYSGLYYGSHGSYEPSFIWRLRKMCSPHGLMPSPERVILLSETQAVGTITHNCLMTGVHSGKVKGSLLRYWRLCPKCDANVLQSNPSAQLQIS